MLVSIITATFNSINYISDAIESLSNQTFQNVELIIIDGGSDDGTLEFLRKNDKVSLLISEKDKGIYDALNKGLKAANGNVVGFLHSDDMLASSGTLQNIVDAFTTLDPADQRQPDAVYGDLIFIDKADSNKILRFWRSKAFTTGLLNKGWMPPHPTLFMRREVYAKHGYFDINFKCASDYDYILRVFSDNTLKKKYLPEVVIRMRMGGESTGSIRSIINKSAEDYHILKRNRMPWPLGILFLKNVSKLPQLFFKESRMKIQTQLDKNYI